MLDGTFLLFFIKYINDKAQAIAGYQTVTFTYVSGYFLSGNIAITCPKKPKSVVAMYGLNSWGSSATGYNLIGEVNSGGTNIGLSIANPDGTFPVGTTCTLNVGYICII